MAERLPMTVHQRQLLTQDLAETRSKLEGILSLDRSCFGDKSDAFVRPEEASVALQRLQWALERELAAKQFAKSCLGDR